MLLLSRQECCVCRSFVGSHLVLYLRYSGVTLHMVFTDTVTQVSVLYLVVVIIAQKSVKYLLDAFAAPALTWYMMTVTY